MYVHIFTWVQHFITILALPSISTMFCQYRGYSSQGLYRLRKSNNACVWDDTILFQVITGIKIKKQKLTQNSNQVEELDMVLRSWCLLCKLQQPLWTAEAISLPQFVPWMASSEQSSGNSAGTAPGPSTEKGPFVQPGRQSAAHSFRTQTKGNRNTSLFCFFYFFFFSKLCSTNPSQASCQQRGSILYTEAQPERLAI